MNFTEQQKNQMMVIVLVAVMALAGLAYYHFMFARPRIEQMDNQVAGLERQVQQKQSELAEIKDLLASRERLQKRRAMIQKVIKRLPSRPDAPGFLVALVSILRQTGIIQRAVTPAETVNRNQYTEIPYEIVAFGRYHELGQFLTLVEQNPERFMRVKAMRVSNNLRRPSIHPVNLEITTFMFNRR